MIDITAATGGATRKSADGPIYVLGLGVSHNGAACLLKDGKIAVAIEKERLTKIKGDGGNDQVTMAYCLQAENIKATDLSLIVQNANFGGFAYGSDWYCGRRILPPEVPVVTISHHLAHAWCAFAMSPFDDAAIFVVDGCGNAYEDCTDLEGADIPERPQGDLAALYFEKDSYYRAGKEGVQAVYKDFSPFGRIETDYPMHPPTTRHSIGGLYAAGTRYMFPDTSDLGKLMGLASYGKRPSGDTRILDVCDGRLFMRYDWISDYTNRVTSSADFAQRFSYFADTAALIQGEVEQSLLKLVHNRHRKWPSTKLCLSGGVAMNAVANQKILEESPFDDVFVPPSADDSGLAIGCAYYGWQRILGQPRVLHDGSPFLGRAYPQAMIEQALSHAKQPLQITRPDSMSMAMADALAAGDVIGWYRGGAEFGPRALGHRSILADPRRTQTRDYINARVKFREDFRPFAPAVTCESANRYFCLDRDSPYMLRVVLVREDWRKTLGAVTHVDGSARVQTVARDADPEFHDVLKAFEARTDIPILLNTSLNRKGQPIVETPGEAVRLLCETGLHALAIGPYLVRKQT